MAKHTLYRMNEAHQKLLEKIREHSELSDDEIIEAANHGADSGVSGFIYTQDCVDFYDKNVELIYDLLRESAEGLGYKNIEEMVSKFTRADFLETENGRKNLLSWFVLEEVGRALEDQRIFGRVEQ